MRQRVERWTTLLIKGDDLAIDHRVCPATSRAPLRPPDIFEIVVVSRPQAQVAIPLEPDGPIPVELQLVELLFAGRKQVRS
jgi:hypothetical protein